jgi:hypothetical protein
MLGDRAIVYLFPAYLLAIEVFLRSALSLDSEAFIGPVLASIGLGFIIPLTIPRSAIVNRDETTLSNKERRFIQICWIFILTLTVFWIWSLFLSTFPKKHWWVLHAGYYPGILSCVLGIALSEIKERL